MCPSYQHSYVCSNIGGILRELKQFSVFSELTIQIDQNDYIPDICVYPKRKIDFAADDIIRMTEMPVTVIEVVSPTQAIQDVLGKFPVYFQAGIQSCWLVISPAQTVTVYTAPNQGQLFKTGNVIDTVLKVEIPLEEIFI
jgi:Uma2 family endonuclease